MKISQKYQARSSFEDVNELLNCTKLIKWKDEKGRLPGRDTGGVNTRKVFWMGTKQVSRNWKDSMLKSEHFEWQLGSISNLHHHYGFFLSWISLKDSQLEITTCLFVQIFFMSISWQPYHDFILFYIKMASLLWVMMLMWTVFEWNLNLVSSPGVRTSK